MAVRHPPGRVVAALGAGDGGDVLLEHRPEHLHPHSHGEGQQPLSHRAGERGELHAHPIGKLDSLLTRLQAERNPFNLGHWRLLLLTARDLSRVEDRHLHFYGSRDNLNH